MSDDNNGGIKSLARLAQLRQRDVDQRQAELANRQTLSARARRNVDQLDDLWRNSRPTGLTTPSLWLNSANYKQTVLQIATVHREDLARHEAATGLARQALLLATRRQGAVEQVLTQRVEAQAREQEVQEQKRQDEMASQVWHRSKK